jgi:hypothetical protein
VTAQKRCGSYKPGHEPHYIQVRKSSAPDADRPVAVRVLEVADDGRIAIDYAGRTIELWTHDLGRLRQLVRVAGGMATYQPRWGLLRVVMTVFNVAGPGQEPAPCRRAR